MFAVSGCIGCDIILAQRGRERRAISAVIVATGPQCCAISRLKGKTLFLPLKCRRQSELNSGEPELFGR